MPVDIRVLTPGPVPDDAVQVDPPSWEEMNPTSSWQVAAVQLASG